ncbi:MAG TPA: peptidoglycan-associated lipoprotein Pal [Pedomonas sp.]|nr:peptidoglycan-associated lipoprotein Pal [Pedomonas sp.]
MHKFKVIAVVSGFAMMAAACAKKEEQLPPPPPPPAPAAPAPAPAPAPVTPSVVPGSVQDFVNTVGSDRVFFAYDSYALDEASRATLAKQAEWLKKYPNVSVTIEGHADERGTREYNLALGDRRANSVRTFLVSQGVEAGRVTTISYGKERPEVLGSDEEAHAKNRRGVTVLQGAAS